MTKDRRFDQSFFMLIIKQFVEYWWIYIFAFVALYITQKCQSFLPFFAKELGDLVIAKQTEDIPILKYILVAIAIIIFRTSSRTLFFLPARYLQGKLMHELSCRLESVDPVRFKNESAGQLYQKMYVDVANIRGFIGFALLQLGNIIIAMLVLLPKLVEFDSRLVIALTPMFITFIFFAFTMTFFQRYFKILADLQGEVQNFLIESYNGKQTIKNYHAENSFRDLFSFHSFKELSKGFMAGLGPTLTMPMVKLGVGASFLWGAYIIKQHDIGATSLILYSGFVFLFLEPLMFISWIGGIASRTWGSWIRIKDLIKSIETVSNDEIVLNELNTNNQSISGLKVPFWSKSLDINVSEGKWFVIAGETGSGKSHIMKSMTRYFYTRGKNVSFVAQEPYLYNDSIAQNLFLGRNPDESEKQLANKLLSAFDLQSLTQPGLDLLKVEVGENGKQVSGGQAKRLALIRSLLGGADILIWDDPFSSVDIILERQIMNTIKHYSEFKNKTFIVSSHRLSTVRYCDDFILINKDEGIIDSGDVKQQLREGALGAYFKEQLV